MPIPLNRYPLRAIGSTTFTSTARFVRRFSTVCGDMRSQKTRCSSSQTLVVPLGAIADELTENGFVLRYRTGETDDGLSGKEGTFLICSFWPWPRWRSSARSSGPVT